MDQQLKQYQKSLIALTERVSTEEGFNDTNVPGVRTLRSSSKTCNSPTIYEPMVCLLLQGSKNLYVGDQKIHYNELSYLIIPIMMPVTGEIVQACETSPYIGISVSLDLRELSELLIDMAEHKSEPCQKSCIKMVDADVESMSTFARLLALHDSPQDIPIMLPMLKRELMYRMLKGPAGNQLRQFLLYDSNANRISKVIEIIRKNFNSPLKVKDLADVVHMSESALYSGFKSITAMSPLQYQKHIRLNEARRIMLYEGIEASAAGYQVGYESPSQFSREYSRLFGAPPITDINRVKQNQSLATVSS
ncbi:AraC family transcriptional regulator CmrA [Alteromonas alba]|uniref:AraC family transcriptional regulator CmrA n=1 Tax=Alteromonas alba TaxID=2079529 RepID=A0A2S9V5K1_9ALTE|nr:AraC family transcriptional regulator [Alteromonas alba]PRO71645.1 AraC family transcriptional regulator CmrA [Alteromonas alba]|tara:strand:- start:2819 stop:3736 length:918 start_codon:yes stop_codon:yes gene_type:complete